MTNQSLRVWEVHEFCSQLLYYDAIIQHLDFLDV